MKKLIYGIFVVILAAGVSSLSVAGSCSGGNCGVSCGGGDKKQADQLEKPETIYDFTLKDIEGKAVSLSQYKGKVLLVVNVASKCGYTPQYAGLEKLYKDFKGKGLEIVAFPANNFMNQEPGTSAEIKQFCTEKYGVTFPVFEKISVKGKDIHPLYKWLTDKEIHPEYGGEITWNFNKFLISKEGKIINRFDSKIKPEDPNLVMMIEAALREKPAEK